MKGNGKGNGKAKWKGNGRDWEIGRLNGRGREGEGNVSDYVADIVMSSKRGFPSKLTVYE